MTATEIVAEKEVETSIEPDFVLLTVPERTLMEFSQDLTGTDAATGRFLIAGPMEIQVKSGATVQIDENSFMLMNEFTDDLDALPTGDSFETERTLEAGTKVIITDETTTTFDGPMKARFADHITVCVPAGSKLQQKSSSVRMRLDIACKGVIKKTCRGTTATVPGRTRDSLFVGADNDILVYGISSKYQLSTLRGHENNIGCLCMSPNGAYLASGDSTGRLIIWNTHTLQAVSTLELKYSVHTISFSPCGSKLAIANDNLIIIDLATFKHNTYWQQGNVMMACNDTSRGNISAAHYTPNNKYLCCVPTTHLVLLDPITLKQVNGYYMSSPGAYRSSVSPDSKYIAIGRSNDVNLFEIESGFCKVINETKFGRAIVSSVGFSPDSTELVIGYYFGSTGNYIRVYDIAKGADKQILCGDSTDPTVVSHGGYVNVVAYCDDKIVSAGKDNRVIVWDAGTGQKLKVIKTKTDPKHICC